MTLRELALEKMRQAILDFHFKPGERLVERKLVEELGVSRTVVREVLRHLDSEGLVRMTPNHGPSVAVINQDEAVQIYQLRAALESMAVRELAGKRDAAAIEILEATLLGIEKAFKDNDRSEVVKQTEVFYRTIFLASGMSVAWDIVRNLNARINVLRTMTIGSAGRSQTGPKEMREIVNAIASGDADKAEAACRMHVEAACKIAVQLLADQKASMDRASGKPGSR